MAGGRMFCADYYNISADYKQAEGSSVKYLFEYVNAAIFCVEKSDRKCSLMYCIIL